MPKRKHAHLALEAFLQKTYAVLENPSFSSVISWDEAGTSFEIKDVSVFSSTVLLHCYHLSDYASFLHQLSLFDFRREPGRYTFSRTDFTRERGMRARGRRSREEREVEEAAEEDYQQLVHHISLLQRSQSALKQEIADLQDNHNAFKETNERLQEELLRFRDRSDRIEQVLSRFYSCTNLHLDKLPLSPLTTDPEGLPSTFLPESTEEEIKVQS